MEMLLQDIMMNKNPELRFIRGRIGQMPKNDSLLYEAPKADEVKAN